MGYYLSGRINNAAPVRLHNYIWIKYNGAIPKGYHIHHKDKNTDNNTIENLACIKGKNHLSAHSLEEDRREQSKKNMIENVLPKLREWNKSPEGQEWHRRHIEKHRDKMRMKHNYLKVCENCGKVFEGVKKSKYCSNACNSAQRRKSGLDDVTKPCVKCGKEFTRNKYLKRKYCSVECMYQDESNICKAREERKRLQYGSQGNA